MLEYFNRLTIEAESGKGWFSLDEFIESDFSEIMLVIDGHLDASAPCSYQVAFRQTLRASAATLCGSSGRGSRL